MASRGGRGLIVSKLLVIDRTGSSGMRVIHMLAFSLEACDFRVVSYYRVKGDVEERMTTLPAFLASATERDKQALLVSIDALLSLDSTPHLRGAEPEG